MRKFLTIGLFLLSMAAAGWAINDYVSSGEQVAVFPLEEHQGSITSLSLDPSMSPARVFLKVRFDIHLSDVSNKAYRYDIEVKDPAGTVVVSEDRVHSEKQEDRGSESRNTRSNHTIGTFEVQDRGIYSIDWAIAPKKAKLREMSLELRRNVEGMNIPLLVFAGICFVLTWVLLLTQRRSS